MSTFEEILALCREWADGTRTDREHAEELTDHVGKQPDAWWKAIITVVNETDSSNAIKNLAEGPLTALALLNPDWITRTGKIVGRDERLATLLVDCLSVLSESSGKESMQILGEDFVLDAYLAIDDEGGRTHHWAWAVLHSIVESDAPSGWAATLTVIKRASDGLLEWVGADILEDAVKLHAAELIERLEAECRTNPKLRRALAHTYLWVLPIDLFERIEAAAGVPLYRPELPKYPGELPAG